MSLLLFSVSRHIAHTPHVSTRFASGMASVIKNTLAENFGGAAQNVATHKFALQDTPDLSGKVAVITGGSEGIGYGTSYTLLSHNIAHIHMISTSKEVVDGALDSIKSELGEEAAKKVTWYQCDLSDWAKAAQTANQIAKATDRIDILFNNAGRGIMTYQKTEYGVDRHFALNHVGHVVLTSHLLPTLKKTAEAGHTVRIVSQASNAHQGAPSDTKFASLDELNQDLGPNGQYGRSKLANILHMRYLNKHLTKTHPNILANATHPGFVSTKMSKEDIHEPYPLAGYAMSVGMEMFKKDQFEGALSGVFACTKTEESGQYICPPAVPEPGSKMSQDEELMEQCMKLTRELVKEKFGAESVDKGCPLKDY
jgi:NAD(P)-dependent dehydrogenase (short-subunit alcohol dehydrogenase family)